MGAAVTLRRLPDLDDAQITVFLTNIGQGDAIAGTGLHPRDGNRIRAAHVQIWWNGNRELTRGGTILWWITDILALFT